DRGNTMIRLGRRYQHLVRDAECPCCDPALQRATQGLEEFTRRTLLAGAGAALIQAAAPKSVIAQPSGQEAKIVLRQIRLFDGKSDALRSNVQVLVTGNKITAIDATNSAPPRGARRRSGEQSPIRRPGLNFHGLDGGGQSDSAARIYDRARHGRTDFDVQAG